MFGSLSSCKQTFFLNEVQQPFHGASLSDKTSKVSRVYAVNSAMHDYSSTFSLFPNEMKTNREGKVMQMNGRWNWKNEMKLVHQKEATWGECFSVIFSKNKDHICTVHSYRLRLSEMWEKVKNMIWVYMLGKRFVSLSHCLLAVIPKRPHGAFWNATNQSDDPPRLNMCRS